ncbi:MAG: hypothetical protein Q7T53_09865 [Deltaproteobacteria bacterium]|nr:hypothetical protein [Deltaproteobacteria bacterium]
MSEDINQNIISEALNKPYSRFCLDIITLQNEHQEKTLKGMYVYVKLFEDNLEQLSSAILGLNHVPKKDWKPHNALQAVLISKTPKTLFSAFQQVLHGDHHEGLATCRIAYETLLAVCFIAKYPESQWSIIKAQKGERAFNPSNFLKDNLKVVDEDPFYGFLSYPIHCQKLSVMSDLKVGMERGLILDLGYRYDDKELSIALNNLIAVLYFSSRLFQRIFNDFLHNTRYYLNDLKALEISIKGMPNQFSEFPVLVDKIVSAL